MASKRVLGLLCLLAPVAALTPRTGRVKSVLANAEIRKQLASGVLAAAFGLSFCPAVTLADGQTEKFKLPPIDRADKNRCTFRSSTIGQANAARDKLYDLRECDMQKKDAAGFDLSGAILSNADFRGANFKEAQLSKAYAENAKFDDVDFTNAVVDRVDFKGSSMKNVRFNNAVLTGSNFESTNVENADFTGAYIGKFDLRKLCENPTLTGTNPITGEDTFESIGGCPGK